MMELHPLCTLFPRLTGAEFEALRAFTGVCKNRPALASFHASDEAPGYWGFSISDGYSRDQISSLKPISSEGIALLLNEFGGACNWVLTPYSNDVKHKQTPVTERITKIPLGMDIVYFLRAGDFIKIGKATGNPMSRIATLKTGCPFKIDVMAYMPGGIAEERELHKKFSNLKSHGEWFHADPALIEHIESIGASA
jgi:hypothetical protein